MLWQANIQAVATQLKFFGTVVLIIGLLSMAILQTAKDLLPWRRSFQKRCMRRWLAEGARTFLFRENPSESKRGSVLQAFKVALNAKVPNPDYFRSGRAATLKFPWDRQLESPVATVVDFALFDLARLATAGDEKALYDLPIEQLCGQINAALQLALESPLAHAVLLWCMGHFTNATDLDEVLNPPLGELQKLQNDSSVDRTKLDVYATARTRVSQKLQRGVDGFQIAAGNHWKSVLQWASIVLSMVLAILALVFPLGIAPVVAREVPLTRLQILQMLGQHFLIVLGIGLAGGFIAPIARDLLAVVSRLRS